MGYPSEIDIINLLHSDSLSNAEKVTGKSYKDDKNTSNLGFILSIHDNMIKEKALKDIGDTTFSMDWLAYCEMIESFGFGLMLNDLSTDGSESLRIYYHEKDGILLCTDSFSGQRNSATAYYNFMPNLKPKKEWKDKGIPELVNFYKAVSSGTICSAGEDELLKNAIWSGDHDAREGLLSKINYLKKFGRFIPVWKNQPHLWLLGNWESKYEGEDRQEKYDEIRADRISKLPVWVQKNIKGIKK